MPVLSDEEFERIFNAEGAGGIVRLTGQLENGVYHRRRRLEKKLGRLLTAPSMASVNYPGMVPLDVINGQVIIASDLHIWPGDASTCLLALKKFVDDIKPAAVILNGDVMDFPKISRHPQTWETAPDPIEEIEAAQDHLNDIVSRCKRGAQKIWTIGNHDQRFEATIANAIPQYKGVKGVHLADHFSVWQKAMSVKINDHIESGRTVVKHRLAGGTHATYNNVKKAGTHIVTGHLHAQNVRSVSDYRSFDLYGVDTGCIADKEHRAFTYTENAPADWRSGFAILSYREGRLMMPELITKWDDEHVQFRGQLHRVSHAKNSKEAPKRKAA